MARKPADQSVNCDDIIRAAADVLRENGYDATTMKDIAARVNLTAASLYHHFRSKDFLLLAVLESGLTHAIAQIEPITCSTLSIPEKLTSMVKVHIREVTANPAVGAAMVFEIRALMNVATYPRSAEERAELISRRDEFFQQRDTFENLFREVIRHGIHSGLFREVDAAIVTKAMLGAQNWVGVWYKEGGRLSGEAIGAIIADTFLHALCI